MSVKKNIFRLLPILAAICVLSSCAEKYKDIRVTSFEVLSFNPRSIRSADAEIMLGISNPAGEITISSIEADVMSGNKSVCVLSAGPVVVAPRTDQTYKLMCNASLPKDITLLEFLKRISSAGEDEFLIDVTAGVRLNGGKERVLKFAGIKLSDLL